MALIGDMIHDSYKGNPAIVNYCMFVAVFALLSLIYLFPATFKEDLSIHPLFPLIVDLLNVLFWFCAAVAMAAKLGVHSCNNEVGGGAQTRTTGVAVETDHGTELRGP